MWIPSSTGRMFLTSLIGKATPSFRIKWGTGSLEHSAVTVNGITMWRNSSVGVIQLLPGNRIPL